MLDPKVTNSSITVCIIIIANAPFKLIDPCGRNEGGVNSEQTLLNEYGILESHQVI